MPLSILYNILKGGIFYMFIEVLFSIVGAFIGAILGLVICYGLREILRHFIDDENTVDSISAIIVFILLIIMLASLYCLI